MSEETLPGTTIGILGDDIVSSYLAQAAQRQGFLVAGYSDYEDAPVIKKADYRLIGHEELTNLIGLSNLITYASSWVPNHVISTLEETAVHLPQGLDLISFTDDHALSKAFAEEQALNILPYEIGTSLDDVAAAARTLGYPIIVKPNYRHHQGNRAVVVKGAYDLGKVAPLIDGVPVIIESFLENIQEYSLTAVRDKDGEFVFYPLRQTQVEANQLHCAWTVGTTNNTVRQEMNDITTKVGTALNYIGAYAVHFFYSDAGNLYVRDITAGIERVDLMYGDICNCSVEEQHLRAITGQKVMPVVTQQEGAFMPLVPGNLNKLKFQWGIHDNWHVNIYPDVPYSVQCGHVVIAGTDIEKVLNQIHVVQMWDFDKIKE
ncbi:ATP-grasp domain-containing protein [Weissella minor]|uniref:ATP-grasp domain-containing protein n=1 Tax=Weissella minor TaxID=1620 RepID=UPI001BAEA888|nr:ATP-grasp domain-containing protein [Weissella minor]MBS0949889.1 ATP-grasp domain-containing protein [Weissella minor]